MPMEVNFKQGGPTTKNARVWWVEVWAKGTKSTPVPFSRGNYNLWCPVWDKT